MPFIEERYHATCKKKPVTFATYNVPLYDFHQSKTFAVAEPETWQRGQKNYIFFIPQMY